MLNPQVPTRNPLTSWPPPIAAVSCSGCILHSNAGAPTTEYTDTTAPVEVGPCALAACERETLTWSPQSRVRVLRPGHVGQCGRFTPFCGRAATLDGGAPKGSTDLVHKACAPRLYPAQGQPAMPPQGDSPPSIAHPPAAATFFGPSERTASPTGPRCRSDANHDIRDRLLPRNCSSQ